MDSGDAMRDYKAVVRQPDLGLGVLRPYVVQVLVGLK